MGLKFLASPLRFFLALREVALLQQSRSVVESELSPVRRRVMQRKQKEQRKADEPKRPERPVPAGRYTAPIAGT